MQKSESMSSDSGIDRPRKVFIWSVKESHTTARYFEKCIQKSGIEVVYKTYPDLSEIQSDDLVWFIDPSPTKWFEHYHLLPCPAFGYLIDTHLDSRYRALLVPFFDELFVAQKEAIEKEFSFTHAQWLPLACDTQLFQKDRDLNPEWEVGFVGQWGDSSQARHQFLKTIESQFRMNPQNRFYSPEEMAGVYRSSQIVVNHSVKGDLNMRVFEGMASGALLVTDQIGNGLESILKDGVHCVLYRSSREAIEKINYYLQNPDAAEMIRKAGQEFILRHHTYLHRWEEVLQKWRTKRGAFSSSIRSESNPSRWNKMAKIAAAHGDPSEWWRYYRKIPWHADLWLEGMRALRRYRHHRKIKKTSRSE